MNILIGVVYRHPKKTSDNNFNTYLQSKLLKIKSENKRIFIIGDFNYCLLKYSHNVNTKTFVDLMFDNHIQPCITEPSRIIGGQKPSIVGNIFTNIIEKSILSGKLISKISDHMPNFVIVTDLTSNLN